MTGATFSTALSSADTMVAPAPMLAGASARDRIPLMMPSLPTADDLLPYLRRIDANR